jgi:hypothetical protein
MLGEVGNGLIIYTYISYIRIITYCYMQQSRHVTDQRLKEIRKTFKFDRVLAKIYRKGSYGEPLVPFTDEDKRSCSQAKVFVMINHHSTSSYHYEPPPSCVYGHILSPINVDEMSKQGLIYSRITNQYDTNHQGIPIQQGINEYWYLVQDQDHLSEYNPGPSLRPDVKQDLVERLFGSEENTRFDDVARGYIRLVTNKELRDEYNVVTPYACAGGGAVAGDAQSIADAMADNDDPFLPMSSSSSSKGGNKSKTKKRKNKRKTRNKRRRNKTRKN